MQINPYLSFNGNCEEAFRFYEKHLGGRINMIMHQNELPGAPSDAGNAVVHAQMQLGETLLIGNDVPADVFQRMRSVYLYLSVDSAADAERIHALLAEEGEIYMKQEETFYATRFSMLRDRFGVSWTVIHEKK